MIVRNESGFDIAKFSCVYLNGTAASGEPLVNLANASVAGSWPVVGITADIIADGTNGEIATDGYLNGVDTSGYSVGAWLYLSDTISGGLTSTSPSFPSISQRIATVLSSDATGGTVIISIQATHNDQVGGVSLYAGLSSINELEVIAANLASRVMVRQRGTNASNAVHLHPAYYMQPGLFQRSVLMYVPSTGSTGTGSGTSLGPVWTSGGTVTHPTPSSTSPSVSSQMRRTRYANVVTTQNQTLGIKAAAADSLFCWMGNADDLGGFFYATRFIVDSWPAGTCRIFAGLTASSSTYVVASDTVLNNTCGLWHDTTDPGSGAGAFNFVTRDGTTTTKQQVTLSNAIAAGNSYDFYMYCPPYFSGETPTIYFELYDLVNSVSYADNYATETLPTATTFMGPQCAMSNGTANTTSDTVAIGISRVYVEAMY